MAAKKKLANESREARTRVGMHHGRDDIRRRFSEKLSALEFGTSAD